MRGRKVGERKWGSRQYFPSAAYRNFLDGKTRGEEKEKVIPQAEMRAWGIRGGGGR